MGRPTRNVLEQADGANRSVTAEIEPMQGSFRNADQVPRFHLDRDDIATFWSDVKQSVTFYDETYLVFVMNAYQGVPIPVLIFVSVALIGVFLTTSTVFGRYLYAIGGNPEASRLSGINNKRNILKVYALLGAFTGIAALIFTARVGSAAPDAGTLKELDAIAACVIGGASLMGGRGTVFGACIGALIMASLDNGMSLLNVRDFMQDIVKGSILVAAVGLDMVGRRQN